MNQMYSLGGGLGIALLITAWVLFWKGWALWTAAKRGEKAWFIILLIINLFGILEIIYIFFVAKKKLSDLQNIFTKKKAPEKTENQN